MHARRKTKNILWFHRERERETLKDETMSVDDFIRRRRCCFRLRLSILPNSTLNNTHFRLGSFVDEWYLSLKLARTNLRRTPIHPREKRKKRELRKIEACDENEIIVAKLFPSIYVRWWIIKRCCLLWAMISGRKMTFVSLFPAARTATQRRPTIFGVNETFLFYRIFTGAFQGAESVSVYVENLKNHRTTIFISLRDSTRLLDFIIVDGR